MDGLFLPGNGGTLSRVRQLDRILFEVTLMPQGADIGLAAANNLEHCQVHQKFQVPKMEVLNLIRQFLGWGFPLHKPYIQHR